MKEEIRKQCLKLLHFNKFYFLVLFYNPQTRSTEEIIDLTHKNLLTIFRYGIFKNKIVSTNNLNESILTGRSS